MAVEININQVKEFCTQDLYWRIALDSQLSKQVKLDFAHKFRLTTPDMFYSTYEKYLLVFIAEAC